MAISKSIEPNPESLYMVGEVPVPLGAGGKPWPLNAWVLGKGGPGSPGATPKLCLQIWLILHYP